MTREPSISAGVTEGMNKLTVIAVGLIAALSLPAAVAAKPSDRDRQAAQKQCKLERGKTRATREAFKAKYRSMSRCVRENATEEEAERQQAKSNAAKDCKAERQSLGVQAFAEKYGANKNKKNALGKCVSAKAREKKAEMDAADAEAAAEFKNAAKACASERASDKQAFADKYGTNRNDRDAFGNCVAGKSARA
jgi:hypothetical protein